MNWLPRFACLVLAALCAAAILPGACLGSDADAMDKLFAPIALYPDALLGQVLTAATSPEQVTEFKKWLDQQTLKGSELQQAAMDAKFDAAFASLAVFPDVVNLLAGNMDWTKEIGTAYLSSKDQVSASIQRLRAQAEAKGNLKSNEQQEVKVTNEGGSQTIIIEPANPQVVYVPQYDPNVVYTQSSSSSSSNDAAVAALVGFSIGIAIGAAMSNDYYGWGAWGYGWHGGGVHYHHSVWVVPARPRYPYARPMPAYRPSTRVAPPRQSNINRNNNNRVNNGNRVDARDTNRGRTDRGATATDRGRADASRPSTSEARGRSSDSRDVASDRSAFGDYGSGSSARAASDRGRSSAGSSRGGGGRSGGGSRGGGGGRRR